jgi:hypothetical protein
MSTGVGVVRADEMTAAGATNERRRGGVVGFDVTRRRHRVRAVAAMLAATLVLMTGLGMAGALPDALQRPFASALRHFGIDVPAPDEARSPRPASDAGARATTPGDATATSLPATEPATTGVPDLPASSEPGTPPSSPPPGGGAPGVPPVALPLPAIPAVTLPPVTLPPLPGAGDTEGDLPPPPPPPPAVDVPVPLPPVPLPPLPAPLPSLPLPPLTPLATGGG